MGTGTGTGVCGWNSVEEMLEAHEGCRTTAYLDTEGNWTIGVGHLLAEEIYDTWSNDQIRDVLHEDLQIVYESLDNHIPWWREQSRVRQWALVDMCFNLGIIRLLQFKQMLIAWKAGDYEEAARQALNSRWAVQVKSRANAVAMMIKVGA